ncbi:MAG TPA: hypothetical protein VFR75_08435 [Solirubrobacterales bacterium]|nr:hypothetical protein [Solirubrobacterales bacterium]
MEADDQKKVGTLVAKGKLFGPLQADALALAALIKSYANTVYEVAKHGMRPGDQPAHPGVSGLRLASACVDFVVGANEAINMDEDSQPAIRAARVVSDLMKARDDELIELAQEIGPEGAKAYRVLLKAIGDADDAKVTWEAPGRAPATVTSIEAQKAHRTLSREGDTETDEFTVLGHLSMADDHLNRFVLRLFEHGPRPPQVKNKQIIRGKFEDHVGDLVKQNGLWGEDVEAHIHLERERAETVATPREPKFTLLSAKATTRPPEPQKGGGPMPGSAPLDEGIDVDVFGDSEQGS